MATSRVSLPFDVKLQSFLGRIFYIPFMWVVFVVYKLRRIKVENQSEFRKYYRSLFGKDELPLIICPNHLTYADSVVIIYAFGNHFSYPFHFRRHVWNLVAAEYKKNPVFRFICYFSKCLFVDRGTEKRGNYPILSRARKLLQNGEPLLIFPEGRRSRTGRFDEGKLAYGVGKLVEQLGECRVLCTYLRCPEQGDKSGKFPPYKAHYRMLIDPVVYRVKDLGEDPTKEVTLDISRRIKKLENEYFATLNI